MNEPLSILLPYQRRWIADQSQVKVSEKSRRIGITWTEAADRALGAATTGRAGIDGWYIGYNKDMALEFIEAAAGWARRFNRAAQAIEEVAIGDERASILAYRIRFASGHKIVALSSRPSNLRGKQGRAVIDEAAFHDKPPRTDEGRDGVHDVGRVGARDLDPQRRREPVQRTGQRYPRRAAPVLAPSRDARRRARRGTVPSDLPEGRA